MSNRRRCRVCNKCLITNKNWKISAKEKNDYICIKCNRNKHNELYLQQREKRIKKSIEQSKKDYKNGSYKYGTKKWAQMTLASHRYRDKKKKLEICNIKTEELLELIKKECEYCKCNSSKITLDRIDNTKGHTKDNVVPCCKLCNTARMASFSYKEMKLLGKTISKIKQQRKKNG